MININLVKEKMAETKKDKKLRLMALEDKLPLREEFVVSAPLGLFSAAMGVLGSLVDPYIIPHLIKEARNGKKIEDSIDFALYAGVSSGYIAGFLGLVVAPIVINPRNPLSYAGLASNIVSGVGQFAYRQSRKTRAEETKNKSGGLETL